MKHKIEESIELSVPAHVAYNQWTQFEDFPRFVDDVTVEQLDDRHLRWRAKVGGKEKVFEAEISEQIPDKRIAWTSTSGTWNAGAVTFHRLAEDRSKVMLQIDYEPEGWIENVGDSLAGVGRRRVKRALESFREFIEGRGHETGAWRGSVESKPDASS